jgi:superfamily II DNA or RNA helicase
MRRRRRGRTLELLARGRMKRAPQPAPETASDPPHEDPLLDALQELPAGSVYALASKNEVAEGFRKFAREEVRRFSRSDDGASMTVEVGFSPVRRVEISLDGGRLAYRCCCREDSADRGCSHLVCALVTLKKVLDEDAFRMVAMGAGYRQLLREHLSLAAQAAQHGEGSATAPPAASLRIDINGRRTEVRVLLNGEEVVAPSHKVPRPLRAFQGFSSFAGPWWETLARYLHEHGNAYPLFLRIDGKEREVRWKGELPGGTRAVFDASGGQVLVTCAAASEGGPGNGAFLRESFFFDPGGGVFGMVRGGEGAKLWRAAYEAFRRGGLELKDGVGGSQDFAISRKAFEETVLALEGEAARNLRDAALFRIEGKPAEAEISRGVALRISILPSARRDDCYLLRAECLHEGHAFPLSVSAFRLFTRGGLPRTLASFPLDGAPIDAFFDGLAAKPGRETDRAIRTAVGQAGLAPFVARQCANIAAFYVASCRAEETRLRITKEGWRLVPGDRLRQAALLEVPYRLFGAGIYARAERPGEMEVGKEELLAKLPQLCARLSEKGFELSFEEKPVRPAAWRIEVDATERGIDWFEIRPEIRCDGALLTEAQWSGPLVREGFVEKDGIVRVLDPLAHQALCALQGAGKTAGKGLPAGFVRVPRLAILEVMRWRELGVTVHLAEEDRRILERLADFRRIEERALSGDLARRLRPYQKEGYSWLAFLYESRFGACLADDMGLGKTVQAIALLAGIREGRIRSRAEAGTPSLVVAPPTLLFNWENEIRKFYPSLSIRTYRGKDRSADFSGTDVVLTSYDLARRDIDALREAPFDVIVFDEVQAVKNLFAGTTGAVRRLRGAFKLALTGTPVENHVGEYFSILDLVLPGLLGEYDDLKKEIRRESPGFVEEVKRKTRPFVLRRTKGQILTELPPKTEDDVYLELTDRQKALYRRTVEEVRRTVDDAYRTKTEAQARVIALTAILKLRQLCLSPALLAPGIKEPSPKVAYLLDKAAELAREGHSALVFSQFTSFLDLVGEELAAAGIDFLRLDGSTPVARRKRLVETFQRGEGPSLFLLSLKAGGKGLNLTRAGYVFHLDPWWNPAVERQAADRAHRIGQKKRVTVRRLLMRHTVEEKMMELKARKAALYAALLGEAEGRGTAAITREDFLRLLEG